MIIYEMNARVYGKPFDQIGDLELKQLTDLGFDWLWVMGIWEISKAGREISRQQAADFEGSPYAITEYKVNPDLGGEAALADLVKRAHRLGLQVMADFVPNHMAVDSPLIDTRPDFFIHSNPSIREERHHDYFHHPSGRRLAHGRDPYFAGWTDTVQLDYVHPELRAHQIETLKRIAGMVDGLRCDMAMLVLREQIKNQWFTWVDWPAFDYHMPGEFWSEAIDAVRSVREDFIFMAEVYWDKEHQLQQLGFDLTYNKKLYDLLAHNHPVHEIAGYLQSTSNDYLKRSVHFLENHDEERAAHRFGTRARPAAALSYAILGVPFVHQGQMEGFTEKLPVQRIRPLKPETADEELPQFYARLVEIVRAPLFRDGEMRILGVESNLVLLERRHEGRVALVGVDTTATPCLVNPAVELDITRLGFSPESRVRCLDLWTGMVVDAVQNRDGRLSIPMGAITGWSQVGGFFLELFKI